VIVERLEKMASLQIGIILVGEWHLSSILHFLLVLLEEGLVDGGSWGGKGGSSNKFLIVC
jgi:hypothetical protein